MTAGQEPVADAAGTPAERRIGVYICHCGGNISDYVDVEAVRDALKDEPGVVVSQSPVFACSDGTYSPVPDGADPDDVADCVAPNLDDCKDICVGAKVRAQTWHVGNLVATIHDERSST